MTGPTLRVVTNLTPITTSLLTCARSDPDRHLGRKSLTTPLSLG